MAKGAINNILIPNVTKVSGNKKVEESNKLQQGQQSDFKRLLDTKITDAKKDHGIQLSVHAARRLQERGMSMDNDEFFKIKNAMSALKNKGGQDSLIITGKGAYIVDVNNNKIVTAMDKDNMRENVFTKIDSTMILN